MKKNAEAAPYHFAVPPLTQGEIYYAERGHAPAARTLSQGRCRGAERTAPRDTAASLFLLPENAEGRAPRTGYRTENLLRSAERPF